MGLGLWCVLSAGLLARALNESESRRGPCTPGYIHYEGQCYRVTYRAGSFVQCQEEICPSIGGTLAIINDPARNDFLWGVVEELTKHTGTAAWIGLYRDLRSGEGDWSWVDGAPVSFTTWLPGQPQAWNGCQAENCAILAPTCSWCTRAELHARANLTGWEDTLCTKSEHCLCQHGGNSSEAYRQSRGALGWEGHIVDMKWWYNRLSPFLYLPPCALLETVYRWCRRRPKAHPNWMSTEASPSLSLSYGYLLDGRGGRVDVDNLVHRWVVLGGWFGITYGLVLFALAATFALQKRKIRISVFVNIFELFSMFVCKLVISLSAYAVHHYLSPVSKIVAGKWILVVAASMMLLAVCALLLTFGACVNLLRPTDWCTSTRFLLWSMLLSMIFHNTAGFALFRVYRRAASYAGDMHVFTRVVGWWWGTLICGTFGAGFFLWGGGGEFAFDDEKYPSPTKMTPFFFTCAASCQLVAGLSILRANRRLRAYFQSPAGKVMFAEINDRVVPSILRDDAASELHGRLGRSYVE